MAEVINENEEIVVIDPEQILLESLEQSNELCCKSNNTKDREQYHKERIDLISKLIDIKKMLNDYEIEKEKINNQKKQNLIKEISDDVKDIGKAVGVFGGGAMLIRWLWKMQEDEKWLTQEGTRRIGKIVDTCLKLFTK